MITTGEYLASTFAGRCMSKADETDNTNLEDLDNGSESDENNEENFLQEDDEESFLKYIADEIVEEYPNSKLLFSRLQVLAQEQMQGKDISGQIISFVENDSY